MDGKKEKVMGNARKKEDGGNEEGVYEERYSGQ
jgi:hypothetical protein